MIGTEDYSYRIVCGPYYYEGVEIKECLTDQQGIELNATERFGSMMAIMMLLISGESWQSAIETIGYWESWMAHPAHSEIMLLLNPGFQEYNSRFDNEVLPLARESIEKKDPVIRQEVSQLLGKILRDYMNNSLFELHDN
jgi:hypothetical protein